MPILKRDEWLKLSPKGKLLHQIQRHIDRIDSLKARYERARASGKISEPIEFMESGKDER
ncbi:MAG: hypothetical protein CL945_00215 [Dinoroseobacter sp.]|nr:hypothetical protein [Dinoroseobacter sp.]